MGVCCGSDMLDPVHPLQVRAGASCQLVVAEEAQDGRKLGGLPGHRHQPLWVSPDLRTNQITRFTALQVHC